MVSITNVRTDRRDRQTTIILRSNDSRPDSENLNIRISIIAGSRSIAVQLVNRIFYDPSKERDDQC